MPDLRFLSLKPSLPTFDLDKVDPQNPKETIKGTNIVIDITKRIEETYDNIITENPVEKKDGSSGIATDHIANLPIKLSIEGGFTDTFVNNLTGAGYDAFNMKGSAKTKFDTLLSLYRKKDTFDLLDGVNLLRDMQFKSLKLIKDKEGFSIFFQAELWQIFKIKLPGTADVETDATPNRKQTAPATKTNVGTLSTTKL